MDQSKETWLHATLQSVIDSGKHADSKAQTLLGFTGIFLNISFGAFLAVGVARLPALTFLPAIVFYSISILFSLLTLWSRGIFGSSRRGLDYFAHIANYPNVGTLSEDIRAKMESASETDDLIASLLHSARISKRKHQLVNLAFIFSGLGLGSFLILALLILSR